MTDPTLEWLLACLAWHTGSLCCLMCLSRTILKHWLRGGKWNREDELEMDWKRKEEACTHHPNLTNGAICFSVFTPTSAVVNSSQCRGTWLFAFISSHKIFLFFFWCSSVFNSTQKRSAEIWVCCRNAEMLWNTISKRHSAIFQIAIDSVNQSRETFQPLWQALSKASLFLETRFSHSL